MQKLFCFALLALTWCPPPARYIVADVTAARAPVEGAMVAAECGEHHKAALRTDDEGRARMRVYHSTDQCSLTVAKPGFPTVETGLVNVCPTPGACTPTHVELAALLAPPARPMSPLRPRATSTSTSTSSEYATPVEVAPSPRPINRMEVAQ